MNRFAAMLIYLLVNENYFFRSSPPAGHFNDSPDVVDTKNLYNKIKFLKNDKAL